MDWVIGVDFGSDSARAVVVDTEDGHKIGEGICDYPRWMKNQYCNPSKGMFRQHPQDYIEALERSVGAALKAAGPKAGERIRAISVDTTGSTPCPVDENGTPLALLPECSDNPNAMFYLWKDHTAIAEAIEINDALRSFEGEDYTRFQGTYSSEWYWAKILHGVRNDETVKRKAYSWVEHCDWIPALLSGRTKPETMYRCSCAAGHKALWHSDFDGLPSAICLGSVDPYLATMVKRYTKEPQTSVHPVGKITKEWAKRLGLNENVVIGGSSLDAHAGAVGAGIKPGTLVKVVGTSTVDMLVNTREDLRGSDLKDCCGQAENSILPGYVGVETGQAAFGDIFAWFKRLLEWPLAELAADENSGISDELYKKVEDRILVMLQKKAEELPEEPFPIALDWFNGRRYPNTDDFQRSAISGLSLGMDAPYLYRSLVFGAVCGLYRLIEGFEKQEIDIEKMIAVGGISKKSPYVMQMLSDLSGREIHILDSDQTCAQGAAMYAAVGAGIYETLEVAAEHMAAKCIKIYKPDSEKKDWSKKHYQEYLKLADAVNKLS